MRHVMNDLETLNRFIKLMNDRKPKTSDILDALDLHRLSRDRKGQWSITVNLPWVVCFTPAKGGGWLDVEITDYH